VVDKLDRLREVSLSVELLLTKLSFRGLRDMV